MLFCGGLGIGLLIWGVAEPIYYMDFPPYQMAKNSPRTGEWAHMLPLFHWGFHAWAIYCLPTIPIAYFYHKKIIKGRTFSSVACFFIWP